MQGKEIQAVVNASIEEAWYGIMCIDEKNHNERLPYRIRMVANKQNKHTVDCAM